MRAVLAITAIAAALALSGCGKHDSNGSSGSSAAGTSGSSTAGTSGGGMTSSGSTGSGSSSSTVTGVTQNGQHTVINGSNGEHVEIGTGSGAKLPDYLSIYPGGTVTSSVTGAGKDGSGGLVVFHVKGADPAAVIAFYKDKAKAAGLADKMSMDMGGAQTYVASNDETAAAGAKKTMTVSVSKKDDGVDAQITWGAN